jgi:hypothetical protein
MRRIVLFALIVAVGAPVAAPAAAQVPQSAMPTQPPGFRTPIDEAAPNRKPVTSGEPTARPASPAEQREAKALAVAVFAKPAAAKKAVEKVEDANAPPIAPAEPKPEWVDKGLQVGGKGLQVTKPF